MSEKEEIINKEEGDSSTETHWPKVLFYTYLQLLTVYGIFFVFIESYLLTTFFSLCLVLLGVLGVTAGAHRLWAHQTYTANTSLKVFLMLCQTLVGQGCIYDWVLYHRLHHKHFCTPQDPFNPDRGFLYSHLKCLLETSSPEQEKLVKEINMSDLEKDSVVMFQKKFYWILYIVVFAFLPSFIPFYYWNESILGATIVAGCMRYGIVLHCAWLIHSATTVLSLQRGEKYPADTNMIFLIDKTYWLRYHYLTPWDYQTSEYGKYGTDCTSAFIRVCAALEFATNLRTADSTLIKRALYAALETKKPIDQCLLEEEANGNIPNDHYLCPTKYY